jgi:DNA-binding transcriptional MerR regulator
MEAPIAPLVSEDKLFYTIGEVAAMFQVNTSLIRFWEKEFDVIKPRKNKKGNRLFTKEDLKNFRTIYYLVKERGYTLEGARQKLKGGKDAIDRDAEIAERLTKFRQFLVELRSSL